MPRPITDISGKTFGHLIAIERVGSARDGYAAWQCICECGTRLSHLEKFCAAV